MDAATYQRVHALFIEAVGLVPSELSAWLDAACGDDPVVRAEVEELLGFVSEEEIFGDAPAATDPMGLVGVRLADRWRIERHVAEGGFAHVYQGVDDDGRAVAVKLFKQALTLKLRRDFEESFAREGALLADLSARAPAVVRAFHAGRWADPRGRAISYTVMEWLEGAPLSEALAADRAAWTLDAVITLLTPIADALAHAHAAGIAHRDVKPDNLFLADGRARLLDFGIAKIAAHFSRGFDATASLMSPVTIAYAAPEQLLRDLGTTGPATDVHGLALVCVELLAGRRPFEGSARQLMLAVPAHDRPTPQALGVAVEPAVEAVFATALARRPGDRFADAAQFWAALTAAARGDAPPKRRWWQRRRRE